MTEIAIIEKMNAMCAESCSPEDFDAWEKIAANLRKTRRALNVDNAGLLQHPCASKVDEGKCEVYYEMSNIIEVINAEKWGECCIGCGRDGEHNASLDRIAAEAELLEAENAKLKGMKLSVMCDCVKSACTDKDGEIKKLEAENASALERYDLPKAEHSCDRPTCAICRPPNHEKILVASGCGPGYTIDADFAGDGD